MEVKFHDIGEGMTEGEVLHYFVEVGDEVTVDQPLVEMQTDKMVAELPSPVAGKITDIHFKLGETVTVGTTMIEIDDGNEKGIETSTTKVDEKKLEMTQEEKPKVEKKTVQWSGTGVPAAPFTRKMARENKIDIEQLQGTGPDGRVLEEDVYAYLEGEETSSVPSNKKAIQHTEKDNMPFKGIRKQIAKNMSHSVRTIPHVTHFEEVDLTDLIELRQELKEMDMHVSMVAFFLKAIGIALQDYPIFNAELDEEKEVIRLYEHIHIGMATDTKAGLVVPVLHHVETQSLKDIHQKMKTLTEKAQKGELGRDDITGGTFTVSNVGPLGGMGATPIINHPQSAIMALHKTKKMPVVTSEDKVEVRSIMNVSLSFDHRIADGADSVRFTNRFVELIESPKKLFMELS